MKYKLLEIFQKTGKLNHAYLMLGDFNCAKQEFDEICQKLGILAIDKTQYLEEFSIGEARDLVKWLSVKPVYLNKKAVLINLDRALLPALNSILKMLEEPPSYSLIILSAKSDRLILPTIKSRCQSIWLGSETLDKSIVIDYNNILQAINEIPGLLEQYSAEDVLAQMIADTKKLEIFKEKQAKIMNYLFKLIEFSRSNANDKMIIENAILTRAKELGDI